MIDSNKVRSHICKTLNVSAEKVVDDALIQDLVLDSFILIDLVIDLQNTFNVRLNQEDLIPVKTVGDLIGVMQKKA